MIDPTRPHHKRAETFAVPSSANMTATAAVDPTSSSNLIDLTANAFAANGYQTARSTASGSQIYQLPQPLVQLNQSKQSNDYYMSSYVLPPPQEVAGGSATASQPTNSNTNTGSVQNQRDTEIQQLKTSTQALTMEVNEMRSAIHAIRNQTTSTPIIDASSK